MTMDKEYFARRTAMRGVANDFLVLRVYVWFLSVTAIVVGATTAYTGEPLWIPGASIGGGLLGCFVAHELRLAREWARLTAGLLCALCSLAALGTLMWKLPGHMFDERSANALFFGAGAIALLNPATARRFRAARTAIDEAESAKQQAAARRADKRAD